MGFSFDGWVLRPPRIAPSNSASTGEPVTGVLRDAREVPPIYALEPQSPEFVDARADQYRTAVLEAPGTTPVEYLLWAANTAQLAVALDPDWWTEEGFGTIPIGELQVTDDTPAVIPPGDPTPVNYGFFEDGTSRVVVQDNGDRSIGNIIALVISRGDVDDYDDEGWTDEDDLSATPIREGTKPYITVLLTALDQDADAGLVRLTREDLIPEPPYDTGQILDVLEGGLSNDRGDRIREVRYALAPAKFWWTRNDRYETRFGWNGTTQKWEPYKGTGSVNVGKLLLDEMYQLDPKVTNLPVNSYLPGDSATPDAYAMIRLGENPGAASTPVDMIRIRPDSEVEDGYDFSNDPTAKAVMGRSNGKLEFNPAYAAQHAGKTIWYSYKHFFETADGIVGPLRDADFQPLFLAPIPGPTDRPLLKLGNRRYLQPILVATDALLEAAASPAVGQVVLSLSTGRLRLSPEDVAKSDPDSVHFDKHFLGEDVVYDGVALNAISQPTKEPTKLLNESGGVAIVGTATEYYLPCEEVLPENFVGSDPYRGLGKSGMLDAPDATGAVPKYPLLDASVRPGGDDSTGQNTGRLRQVTDGVGDTIIFSKKGAVAAVLVVDREDDLPSQPYKVQKGEAYVAREMGAHGSRVMLSRDDLDDWQGGTPGEPVYFLQATVTPATYTTQARLISRNRDIFRFEEAQTLYFAIDGTPYEWTAPTAQSFYTPEEVAADLMANSVPPLPAGAAYAQNGRVVLEAADPDTGSIEVGWGALGSGGVPVKDLSGAAVLGFLPGWRADGGVENWLPDSGAALGMARSPINLDRADATPDIRDRDRIEDGILTKDVPPTPFYFLNYPPLQDIAGFDEGVFFNLQTIITDGDDVQVVNKPLQHYRDIIHRFGQRKFDWVERDTIEGTVDTMTTTLNLGETAVSPESMLGAPGIGGGLYISPDGGPRVLQSQDNDYVLPQNGTPGTVILVERFGSRVASGAQGSFQEGGTAFTDPFADYTNPANPVQVGYRLKVGSSDAEGSYTVQAITSPTELDVLPPFPAASPNPVVWEVFQGFTRDVYDPTVIADITYKDFNHLQTEPFKVLMLSPVGAVPATTPAPPLQANMEAALSSGRLINIRYGLMLATAANTATLVELTQTELGPIANNVLDVPAVTSTRFTTESFSIRVGTVLYSHGSGLNPVASFSPDPGDAIEYLTAVSGPDPVGRLKFGSNVLTSYAAAPVWYVEEFLPAADMAALEVEYRPQTGDLNFSAADMAAFEGTTAYFVEQMITEQRRDVSLSPLLGAFAFTTPIPQDSSIEVEYWRADLEGRKVGEMITEFLPVFVRAEAAVRTARNTYTFGSEDTTIDQRIEPTVYIGPMMQNFGTTDYLVDYPRELNGKGRLTFVRTVEAHIPVTVSYAVFEAQGGEQAYESSQKPVYRPPFFIKAGVSEFGVWGDRTAEFELGQMFRIGEECFYVTKLTYYPPRTDSEGRDKGDVTGIGIFPTTTNEVGTRAPGNDVITVVTSEAVATEVTPHGGSPTPTNAPLGFMSEVDTSVFPFEPVSRGQKHITFTGDLTEFAQPGHVFELDGSPFTISEVTLNDDGTRTKISVTSGFRSGFSMDTPPLVKLSYRPIYPPESRDFLGVGPILLDEPYELVLDGETDSAGNPLPGRTLAEGVEYSLDPGTGNFQLLEPVQAALQPGQFLHLYFTRIRPLQPFLKDGVVATPRYAANFLYGAIPTEANGLLGALLTATYTFYNPDSFYFRCVRLPAFLGEAAREAVEEITSKQPASGAPTTAGGGDENWELGRNGLLGERSNLEDKDRAARTFLDFYNQSIEAFEQVNETISGGFIGDRDGKFRFFVGHDKDWPTPGYEDAISGLVQPRHVWSEVYNEARPDIDLTYLESDWIVAPSTVAISGGVIDGFLPDPSQLRDMTARQGQLVQNDVDDRVFIQLGKRHIARTTSFPFFDYKAKGIYARMTDQHRFSRLYPTLTRAFLMTYPGVGAEPEANDFGVYTYGRSIDGSRQSTHGETIGQLYNPVLEDITTVVTADLGLRFARGRVWAYQPDGIPAAVFTGGTEPVMAIPDPAIIAFPALLRDVPLDPDTNYPDDAQLLSQGGSIPDAGSGDYELAVPGFWQGQQLRWGRPDGTTYELYDRDNPIDVDGEPSFTGIFVREVLYGCVILLQDADDNPIADSGRVLIGLTPDSGIPLHEFPAEQGDTVFVGPPIGSMTGVGPNEFQDPPEFVDFERMANALDSYRTGFDLDIKSDGRLVDKTYPSFHDPFWFGFKELFGQKPPDPMTAIEGPVEFLYMGQNPLRVPALDGGITDDSGDYQIPYMRAGDTELDRFDEIGASFPRVMVAVDGLGNAVYPDEILGNDGEVMTAPALLPATLQTVQDPSRTGVGEGTVRPYDVILMQPPGPFATEGPMGIHTVGAVYDPQPPSPLPPGPPYGFEPPRFVAHTAPAPGGGVSDTGDPVRYTFDDAMVWLDPSQTYPDFPAPGLPGVEVIEDTALGVTILDFSSIGQFELNNGLLPAVGNLNDVWGLVGPKATNVIAIKFILRKDFAVQFWPLGASGPPFPNMSGGVIGITMFIIGPNVWTVDWDGNPLAIPAVVPGITFGDSHPAYPSPTNQQIIVQGTGWFPWFNLGGPPPPPPGQENEWFLPYVTPAPGVYRTLYGQEFSFDINTAGGESTTGWIAEDRLTFHEVYDLRMAKERGYVHPIVPLPPFVQLELESKLVVTEVLAPNPNPAPDPHYWTEVNSYTNGLDPAPPNDPIPYTFLLRHGQTEVGSWEPATAAPEAELATIKVMGFEGHGNTPITGDNVTFSAMPSNDNAEGTTNICGGVGLAAGFHNTDLTPNERRTSDNRLVIETPPALGGLALIQKGDLCVVNSSVDAAHPASTKLGTYLIRHVVEPNAGAPVRREVSPTTVAGAGNGWCPLEFPRVVDFDPATHELTITFLPQTKYTGAPLVNGKYSAFPAVGAGRVYLIRDLSALASGVVADFRYGLISAAYTSFVSPGEEAVFTLDPATYRDALNTLIATDAEFDALIGNRALQVSGMTYLPVAMGGSEYGLPDDNCVGVEDPLAERGFRHVTLCPPIQTGGADLLFTGPAGISTGAGTPLRLRENNPVGSNNFEADLTTPIYHNVVDTLDIMNVPHPQWETLNTAAPPGPTLVDCLLPGTQLAVADLAGPVVPGYWAQGGIFFEPSFPRSVANLSVLDALVVDRTHPIADPLAAVPDWEKESWFRNELEYAGTQYPGGAATTLDAREEVQYTVRSVRRWHEIMEEAGDHFRALRFAYEMRRGRINDYSTNVRQRGVVTASFVMNWNVSNPAAPLAPDVWNDGFSYDGTNLGPFDDPDVNINAGDRFRLLDDDGTLIEEVEITGVEDSVTLKLAMPGITRRTPAELTALGGMRFEIYLRQPPVPHEQSNEQLLELISDREVYRSDADWDTEEGGYVEEIPPGGDYETVVNKMYDDQLTSGSQTFGTVGVRVGDIVVIDPAGTLPQHGGLPAVPDRGARPLGDLGVTSRWPAPPHDWAGKPSELDDNRGFYRVLKVIGGATPHLEVDPISTYAGGINDTNWVTFASGTTPNREYAIYPTISDSGLTGAIAPFEGQMDLRPTAKRDPVTQTYKGNDYSIRPFSYKVIRPSGLFSDEAIDLVLTMRERMLSLVEMLRALLRGWKYGSYYEFQDKEHISDLGIVTDPESGMGVLSNAFIEEIIGELGTVPFMNNRSCLSLLDRRFWIFDLRLDRLTHADPPYQNVAMKLSAPGGTPYTAYTDDIGGGSDVRPVLPERIDLVLDESDRFRPIRYVWLAYRVHKILGTLAGIKRFDEELPERLAERERLLLLEEATESIVE